MSNVIILKRNTDGVAWVVDTQLVGVTREDGFIRAWCGKCLRDHALCVDTASGEWECRECAERGDFQALRTRLGIVSAVEEKAPTTAELHIAAVKGQLHIRPAVPMHGWTMDVVLDAHSKLLAAMEGTDHTASRARAYLETTRRITDESIRLFKLGYVNQDGTEYITFPYFDNGDVTMVRLRNLHDGAEREYTRTPGADAHMYNVDAVRGAKRVVMVRGELNAISLSQSGIRQVVAVPMVKAIPPEWLRAIKHAEQVVLWVQPSDLDSDATQELIRAVGTWRLSVVAPSEHVARAARMAAQVPAEDVNDYVRSPFIDGSDIRSMVTGAHHVPSDLVVTADHFTGMLRDYVNRKTPAMGLPTGLKVFQDTIGGWRSKELTIWTGHTGHGKSTLLHNCMEWLAERGEPVCMTALENTPDALIRNKMQRHLGAPLSSVRTEKDKEHFESTLATINKYPFHVIHMAGLVKLDELLDHVRYSRRKHGTRMVALDHYGYIIPKRPDRKSDECMEETMLTLLTFAEREDVGFHLVMHPNGGVEQDALPNDETIKGGSGGKQNAHNIISVWRDRERAGETTKRNVRLKLGKSRETREFMIAGDEALVDVSKKRHPEAKTGWGIVQFRSRDLRYFDRPAELAEPKHDDTPSDLLDF